MSPKVVACSCFGCLQESELTPSGANLLDGRYAVFGYVVEGQDLLTQLQACSWAVLNVALHFLAGLQMYTPDNLGSRTESVEPFTVRMSFQYIGTMSCRWETLSQVQK